MILLKFKTYCDREEEGREGREREGRDSRDSRDSRREADNHTRGGAGGRHPPRFVVLPVFYRFPVLLV